MALRSLVDVPAPAKLNLFLHVVGRRDDGYHLLQSVFTPIDWCDTLHFERREDGRVQRHDLTTPLPADDLCLRAARALQAATGCRHGADLSIEKRLPSGAGLGGGSSDAATTLLALNRLWGLNLGRARLQAIALGLGADVPFFVGGRPAWVEGIGERLTPIALPAQRYAVVKPAASIETRAIFTSELLRRDTEPAILSGFLADGGAERIAQGHGRNDLQPAAEALCSEVGEAMAWLTHRFGNGRMTGSGSAVFARLSPSAGNADVNDGANGASAAAVTSASAVPVGQGLEGLPPGWTGRICRSLEHHPLVDWAADDA